MNTDDLTRMKVGSKVTHVDGSKGEVTDKGYAAFTVKWDDGLTSNVQLYDLERVLQIELSNNQ